MKDPVFHYYIVDDDPSEAVEHCTTANDYLSLAFISLALAEDVDYGIGADLYAQPLCANYIVFSEGGDEFAPDLVEKLRALIPEYRSPEQRAIAKIRDILDDIS